MVLSVQQLAATLADDLGGDAPDDGHWRHIMSHNSTGSHDCTSADGNSRHDDGTVSDPGIIADGDRAGLVAMIVIVRIMTERPDDRLLGDIDIVSDGQRSSTAVEKYSAVNNAIVTNSNFPGRADFAPHQYAAVPAHTHPRNFEESPPKGMARYVHAMSVEHVD